ncbi:MAG: ATP-binding protein [Clostridia bacterium]|nr:ATP-binding protein [Clostridia bacterium]
MEQSIRDKFMHKAERARQEADERSRIAYSADKRLFEIDRELSDTGLKFFRAALLDDGVREIEYKKIEARVTALKEEKGDRLERAGFPRDFTDVKYECEKCSDTGYVGIKMCDCLKSAIAEINYKASGLGRYLERDSFDSFDLALYPESAKAQMTKIYNKCVEYASAFNKDSDSLLFVGTTGLGKTHLSSAIAKCVLDKGFSVAYDSAQNIISAFEKERFARDSQSAHLTEKYMESDLLIIDDLGAEVHSKSSVSYFYTLINTRLVASRPTIVSTNLTPKQLTSQYEERIVSRLFGEYRVFLFEGEDIRKRKLQ